MKRCQILKDEGGVTLIEIILAVAIFSGVIGMTAQSLMSFYVSIDIQEQRVEAVATCRSVMDSMREKRLEFRDNFPEGLLAWITNQNESAWEDFQADNTEHVELADQNIEVACFNETGEIAAEGDNPIVVHVTTNWVDRKGRPLSASVASMLTNE